MLTIIPPNLPADVKAWTIEHVKQFIEANRDEYRLDGDDVQVVNHQKIYGKDLLELEVKEYREMGLLFGPARHIVSLVDALKKDKGLVVTAQKKRAGSPLDDDDLPSRVKRTKVFQLVPSSLARPHNYDALQQNSTQRILDDRPQEDKDILLVSLLYDGFGLFLDIVAGGQPDVEGFNNDVEALDFLLAVDEFAQSMCEYFEDEDRRREEGLRLLNNIFAAARKDGPHRTMTAAAIGFLRTDGHFTGDHGVVNVVSVFKNPCTSNSAIPEVQLVGYFAHSFAQAVELHNANELDGWRVPALGITVVGPDVKFYAMLNLDTQFRLVSLTPALSCIRSASEGGDRDALYRAFTAAAVLQARMLDDSPHYGLHVKELSPSRCI